MSESSSNINLKTEYSTNSLLILFGESFRLGGQGNRNRGNDNSYKGQIKAAKSHIKFIESLKKKKLI